MNLVIKSLPRDEMDRITKKEYRAILVKDEEFEGTVGLMKIKEIKAPLIINNPNGKVKIADTDYSWLQFAPVKGNWWLTVMFDNEDNLIESYFDITKENIFKDPYKPYFIDMKLDVLIDNKKRISILDEDELEEAFQLSLISHEEFLLAKEVADKIITKYSSNPEKFFSYIKDYFMKLRN